jgi:hypothetical protein
MFSVQRKRDLRGMHSIRVAAVDDTDLHGACGMAHGGEGARSCPWSVGTRGEVGCMGLAPESRSGVMVGVPA